MSRNEEKKPKPRPSRGYVSGAGGEGVEAPAAPRVGTVPVPGPARAGPGWALRDAGARRPLSLPPPEPPRAGGRAAGEGGRARSSAGQRGPGPDGDGRLDDPSPSFGRCGGGRAARRGAGLGAEEAAAGGSPAARQGA